MIINHEIVFFNHELNELNEFLVFFNFIEPSARRKPISLIKKMPAFLFVKYDLII